MEKFKLVDLSGLSDEFIVIHLDKSANIPDNLHRGFIYVGNGFIAGEKVLIKHFIKHLLNGTTDRIKSIIVRL